MKQKNLLCHWPTHIVMCENIGQPEDKQNMSNSDVNYDKFNIKVNCTKLSKNPLLCINKRFTVYKNIRI